MKWVVQDKVLSISPSIQVNVGCNCHFWITENKNTRIIKKMSANLEISTVVGCKMLCDYCPQKSHIQNYSAKVRATKGVLEGFKMKFADYTKYLSTVPTSVDIVFAGMAEPFLNEHASTMISFAYNKGHRVSLYTTCVGMDESDVLALSKITFNHFCLHLPDADGLMKVKITDEYLNILKLIMPIHKNMMCIGKLHPQVREAIGVDVSDGTNSLYSRGGSLKELMIPKKTGKLFCSACTEDLNHNILMPNGDVLLCCMDYDQKHVIGNLNSMSYTELFQSDEYKKIRRGLDGDESIDVLCRKCEVSATVN